MKTRFGVLVVVGVLALARGDAVSAKSPYEADPGFTVAPGQTVTVRGFERCERRGSVTFHTQRTPSATFGPDGVFTVRIPDDAAYGQLHAFIDCPGSYRVGVTFGVGPRAVQAQPTFTG